MAPAERFSAFYCLQSLPEVTHLGECLHTKPASKRNFSSANPCSAWQGGVFGAPGNSCCFCQDKTGVRLVCEGRRKNGRAPGWVSLAGRSPGAFWLLGMSQGRGAAQGVFVMGTKIPHAVQTLPCLRYTSVYYVCSTSGCYRSKPCCFPKPVSRRAGAPKILPPHLPVAQSDALVVSKNRNVAEGKKPKTIVFSLY